MDLAGYVINAVVVEGRGVSEVARAHGVSRSWLYELLARHRERGTEGLTAQSRRPRSSPTRLSAAIEKEIVAMRKALTDEGLDAGAHTSTTTCRAATAADAYSRASNAKTRAPLTVDWF